jgi:hypothetical protein
VSTAATGAPAAAREPLLRSLSPRPLLWGTVLVVAAAMALADAFLVVSLQGAVGAIERVPHPAGRWLRESAVLLPAYTLAVAAALAAARRRFGPAVDGARAVLATVFVLAVVGTGVGLGHAVTSAVVDYRLQAQLVEQQARLHDLSGRRPGSTDATLTPARAAAPSSAGAAEDGLLCGVDCLGRRATAALHLRALGLLAGVLLLVNGLLVGWVAALRGGRLGTLAAREAHG